MKLSKPTLFRLLAIAALLGAMGFAALTTSITPAFAQEADGGDWSLGDDTSSTDDPATDSSGDITTDDNPDDNISSSRHPVED